MMTMSANRDFRTVTSEASRSEGQRPHPAGLGGFKFDKGFSVRKLLFMLAWLGLVVSATCMIMGLFSGANYMFDLLSHFMIQYLVVQAACMLIFLLLLRWDWFVIAVAAMGITGWQIAPYYLDSPPVALGETRHHLKLMQYNVLTGNQDYDALASYIQEIRPDIVALQEVDEGWTAALWTFFKENYPYQMVHPREDNFGIAIYSQYPLENLRTEFYGGLMNYGVSPVPTLLTEVILKPGDAETGRPAESFTLVVTHPLPPTGLVYYRARNGHLAELAEAVRTLPGPRMVVGDLNVTPWSRFMKRFIADTGLRDSQKGFGIQPSWPTNIPELFIPLDHVLVSEEIAVKSRHTGKALGSDHLPVIVELAL